jgi:hypothetical protein
MSPRAEAGGFQATFSVKIYLFDWGIVPFRQTFIDIIGKIPLYFPAPLKKQSLLNHICCKRCPLVI